MGCIAIGCGIGCLRCADFAGLKGLLIGFASVVDFSGCDNGNTFILGKFPLYACLIVYVIFIIKED